NVYLSSRNLKASEVINSSELSTYKIINAHNIVLLEGALKAIESNLAK
ncbi:MAG: 50S ribosomal protein L4, partial [Sinomicrobium sp.]|nr:50S ribosomal protein L4 [Sinomicrobium sp.]